MRQRGLFGVGLAMTALLVGFGSLVTVNAMARQTVEEEHTYAFTGVSLSVELTVGEVKIVPNASDDEVSVTRTLTYGLRRPFVEERVDGDTFRVRDGNCAVPVAADCHVRWLLQVPLNLPVEVTTESGGIIVEGLSGPVKLTSASGSVKAKALSGKSIQLLSHRGPVTGTDLRSSHVVATAGTGAIALEFSSHPTLVIAKSTTGPVGVAVPGGDEPYKILAKHGGSRTITAKNDPGACRKIDVESDRSDVSVLQSSEN
jgi:hypothetical protein